MSDRVSTSITIGGTLPAKHLPAFLDAIITESACGDWEESIETIAELEEHIASDPEEFILRAQEKRGGDLDAITEFCQAHDLTYVHSFDGGDEWAPGVVWWKPGMVETQQSLASDGDEAAIPVSMLTALLARSSNTKIVAGLRATISEFGPPLIPQFEIVGELVADAIPVSRS